MALVCEWFFEAEPSLYVIIIYLRLKVGFSRVETEQQIIFKGDQGNR